MALENQFWVGPEAEGILKGISTLFIKGDLGLDIILNSEIPHIFFTKEFNNWDIIRSVLDAQTKLVTVEVWDNDIYEIPWDVKTRVRLLVRIEADWIGYLKDTDCIIIGQDYQGIAFVKGMSIQSKPDDYQWDKGI